MNFKKIILYGLLFWVILFVLVSIIMFLPFLEKRTLIQSYLTWKVCAFLTIILASFYFKKVEPKYGQGFLFGLGILIVSTILDAAITVPLFVKNYNQFFNDWTLWVGWAVVIAVSMIVCWFWKNYKIEKRQ